MSVSIACLSRLLRASALMRMSIASLCAQDEQSSSKEKFGLRGEHGLASKGRM